MKRPQEAPAHHVPSSQYPIRLMLAESHPVMRLGIRNILNRPPDIQVIGKAPNGSVSVEYARELAPDVLVLDLDMPGLPVVEVLRQLQDLRLGVRTVGTSTYDDAPWVNHAMAWGPCAFVVKDAAPEEYIAAVRHAAD